MMTGRRREINLQLNQLTDAVLLVFSLWLAHVTRYWAPIYTDALDPIAPFSEFLWLIVILIPFGPPLLEAHGYYRYPTQKSAWRSLREILATGLWMAVLIAGCVLGFKLEVPSRMVFIEFAIIAPILLLTKQRLLILWQNAQGHREGFRERVLMAGVPVEMKRLVERFNDEDATRIEIVEQVDIEKRPISDLVQALHRHSVGRVVFAGGHVHLNRIQEAIAACEIEGVEAWLAADFIRTSIARPSFDALANCPMLVFRSTPDLSWSLMVKAIIDFFGALILVILLSPILAAIAIAVRVTSPGPVIFKQLRGGKHGKPFSMLKFRSMYRDAEQRRSELEAHNEMRGPVFKVQDDPRVTPLGKFLRKYSLDELPQIFNVLAGHMSLVGPRPLPLYEVEKFESVAQRRRLSVKPGLTCLWQISGRNDVSDFGDWVRLDLKYIDSWSIWLDIKILFKTIPAVLFGTGAK
ncbi:MAG TPA: sugar transferase [Chthoniobacterales bacterium]